jgi:hypothetical protein
MWAGRAADGSPRAGTFCGAGGPWCPVRRPRYYYLRHGAEPEPHRSSCARALSQASYATRLGTRNLWDSFPRIPQSVSVAHSSSDFASALPSARPSSQRDILRNEERSSCSGGPAVGFLASAVATVSANKKRIPISRRVCLIQLQMTVSVLSERVP